MPTFLVKIFIHFLSVSFCSSIYHLSIYLSKYPPSIYPYECPSIYSYVYPGSRTGTRGKRPVPLPRRVSTGGGSPAPPHDFQTLPTNNRTGPGLDLLIDKRGGGAHALFNKPVLLAFRTLRNILKS